jgi:ubiquinone/menaquinone biosynthesis C-methylase UbiE
MIGKKHTPIENWLWENQKPEPLDSARQTYENLADLGTDHPPLTNKLQDLDDPARFRDEAQIQQIAALVKDAREVLDIGCGDGWPGLRIAPQVRSVTVVDAAARRVEATRANAELLKLANVKFHQMSATELDFADASFGAVVAAGALEQTDDPLRAMAQIFRVLRPGGKLFVQYEALDSRMKRPVAEEVFFREHPDGTLGWHYRLKHRSPAWERNYLVRFESTPETAAAFATARDTIGRIGNNPFEIPEIGVQFLEANKAKIQSCSYYELEAFSAQAMIESLEDAGFTEVHSVYSAGWLADRLLPELETALLKDSQLAILAAGLGRLALELPAPHDQGQPVVATKPQS